MQILQGLSPPALEVSLLEEKPEAPLKFGQMIPDPNAPASEKKKREKKRRKEEEKKRREEI